MYQIVKILNNNGIIVRSLETNDELVFLGKGIGFSKREQDILDQISNVKVYKLQTNEDIENYK